MSLSNLKPASARRGGGGNSGPKTESVVFMVKRYVIANPKTGGAADPNDHIVGALMRPALGLAYSLDEATQTPNSEVKIYLQASDSKGSFSRPEIKDKWRGTRAVEIGGLMRIDGGKLDATKGPNAIVGRWLNTISSKAYDPAKHFAINGMPISLRPEWSNKDSGRKGQYAVTIDKEYAVEFSGTEDFRAKAIAAIEAAGTPDEPAMPGTGGFIVRIVSRTGDEAYAHEVFPRWNKDEARLASAEETVDQFLKSEELSAWATEIAKAEPGNFYEVTPISRVGTGTYSLPSTKAATKIASLPEEMKAKRTSLEPTREEITREDDGIRFCRFPVMEADGKTQKKNERGYEENEVGFVNADLFAQRFENTPDDPSGKKYTEWFRTDFAPIGDRMVFGAAEFITPILPAAIVEKFEKRARDNHQAQYTVRNTASASKDGPAPEDDQNAGPAP